MRAWSEDFVKAVARGKIGGHGCVGIKGIDRRPGMASKKRGQAGKLQAVGQWYIRGQGFGRVCVCSQDARLIHKQNHEKQERPATKANNGAKKIQNKNASG